MDKENRRRTIFEVLPANGKAIYAAGVQLPPVHFKGQTSLPGQANNFHIFPSIGMAVFATQASRVTDEMFIVAARAVADQVPSELLKRDSYIRYQQTSWRQKFRLLRGPRSWCLI